MCDVCVCVCAYIFCDFAHVIMLSDTHRRPVMEIRKQNRCMHARIIHDKRGLDKYNTRKNTRKKTTAHDNQDTHVDSKMGTTGSNDPIIEILKSETPRPSHTHLHNTRNCLLCFLAEIPDLI